jgi:MFS transporter, ACS family, tartrate transporter
VGQALKSPTIVLMAGLAFLNYFVFYTFAFWFPTMLKRQSGLSDVRVGLLGAVPYIAIFLVMQINGWHSDKNCERRWHSAVPMFVSAIGVLGLLGQPRSIPVSIVLFTMASMAFAYLPTFWAIPTEFLSQSAAAAAVGMVNTVGSVAGFAGPHIFGYLNARTGSFSYGLALMTVSALVGGLLILCIPKSARQLGG